MLHCDEYLKRLIFFAWNGGFLRHTCALFVRICFIINHALFQAFINEPSLKRFHTVKIIRIYMPLHKDQCVSHATRDWTNLKPLQLSLLSPDLVIFVVPLKYLHAYDPKYIYNIYIYMYILYISAMGVQFLTMIISVKWVWQKAFCCHTKICNDCCGVKRKMFKYSKQNKLLWKARNMNDVSVVLVWVRVCVHF